MRDKKLSPLARNGKTTIAFARAEDVEQLWRWKKQLTYAENLLRIETEDSRAIAWKKSWSFYGIS